MDKVYIISRYRAENEEELEFNKNVARYFCRQIVDEGKMPIAPYLYYTQFLNEDEPADRAWGLKKGISDLHECKEYLLVIVDGIISDGMKGEIEEIGRLGMSGCIIALTRQEAWDLIK